MSFKVDLHCKKAAWPLTARILGMALLTAILAATGQPAWAGGDAHILRSVIPDAPWDPTSLQEDDSKAIFGEDDRIDVYQETDPQKLQWVASTCGLVSDTDLIENSDGTFGLLVNSWEGYFGIPPCVGMPFRNQPLAAFCSGFMVGPDLLATAGHCVDFSGLAETRFLFGFVMLDEVAPVLTFSSDQIYTGIDLVAWKLEGADDYGVIRTDKAITANKATAFELRSEGVIEEGELVGMIGHPSGLPMKITFSDTSVVTDNSPEEYFSAVIDVFGGNSGSPVINAETGICEGIAARAPYPEFILVGDCVDVVVRPDDGSWDMHVSKSTQFVEAVEEARLGSQGVFDFRATPTRDAQGLSAIALMWTNLPDEDFTKVTLVRSAGQFAQAATDGVVVYEGQAEQFLDTGLQDGVEYLYTLIVDVVVGLPVTDYARAVAGSEAPLILTEQFNGLSPLGLPAGFDLSFCQIVYTPVGRPAAEPGDGAVGVAYEGYEATVRHGIYSLPVPREDVDGGPFLLPITEDGGINTAINPPFPFFGKHYSSIFIATNGYISFREVSDLSLDLPSLTAHFEIPRISALFADLTPYVSGQVWARKLEDSLVITWDFMSEYIYPDWIFKQSGVSTVQAQLFQNGEIRVSYLGVDAELSIAGLSDGRGIPKDPASLADVDEDFEGVEAANELVDFASLPAEPTRLSIEPVEYRFHDAGDMIRFTARTRGPAGMDTPVLSAEWDGPGPVPFGDNRDGTGAFAWQTEPDEDGVYTVRVLATIDEPGAGGDDTVTGREYAYQDIQIWVGEVWLKPIATDLSLSSDTPFEDPTEDRPVDIEGPLMAKYLYGHPFLFENPEFYAEGQTRLHWFRNDQLVSSLTGHARVPAGIMQANEVWYFRVTPLTVSFIAGDVITSPRVTIVALPIIEMVSPTVGTPAGGDTVTITGRRLGPTMEVTFGGVPAAGIRAIAENVLEVTTPLHPAGLVDVAVTSAHGTGLAQDAFQFIGGSFDFLKEDVNVDGRVDAVDVQIVTNAVLASPITKAGVNPDANRDGRINAVDIQVVVNKALLRP